LGGPAEDRFGSKAALTAPKSNFSFTPESGLNSDITHVRNVPIVLKKSFFADG
jgi:hypothetical protein